MDHHWVAITGSKGYIGAILAKHCKMLGYSVLGVDHEYTNLDQPAYVDRVLDCCISDIKFAEACKELNISTVFHLAASADVKLSQEMPFLFYYNNVGNTARMLHNLTQSGWVERNGKIVFSSTAAVYKEISKPVLENSPKGSPNEYGKSKLMCEKLIQKLFSFYKIPSVTFRYFNVAGANKDLGDRIDTSHIIPILCKSAYSGKPFSLYGSDYETKDGTAVRDYLDVNDVCRAHFTAIEYLNSNPGAHIFNLGTKQGTTLNELITKFEDVVKIDLTYALAPRRPGDPGFLVANPDKFINDTGFQYQGNIESIISSSWEFYCYREDKNGF